MTSGYSSMDENITEPVCMPSAFIDQNVLMKFLRFMNHFIFVSAILSSFLQIYVLKQASRHIRRSASDQCLHVFLFSMTMGDFIQTAFCYPMEMMAQILDAEEKVPRYLYVTMHFLTWVTLSGSSLSLVLLNLDKLLYFKYPLRYSNYVTKRRGITLALIVWAICLIFVATAWHFECFKCEDNCSRLQLLKNKWMYLLFSLSRFFRISSKSNRTEFQSHYTLEREISQVKLKSRKLRASVCVVPTLTSLAVALFIVKVVSTHRRRLAEEQALYQSGPARQALASRLRTFYFVFMTTVFTAATLLPYRISAIIMNFSEQHGMSSCGGMLSRWLMNYLISLNAILNPLITVTVLPQYRCRLIGRLLGTSGTETKTADL